MLEQLIEAYVDAYNRKDMPGMLAVLHDDIRFENVSNTGGTMALTGKQAFGEQAAQVVPLFSVRRQEIVTQIITDNRAAIEIYYSAVVAQDMPNGWKANQQIELRGVSIFECKDGKISRISDYS
ncbi:nuclear transport factor 2 family protein [Spirosoma rhododendri]|uniref:Nuclear transport factor 2 family protein n=1 Tax=Spirosoma rhododendri TaxID=2728024 RepID=A0A7L5DI24_9BACT|nr:nuclear transport factor 2 family protein [Spirosoma rhododendri]QJD78024.1 nuclear transport factor 2 family protein [Spirosoma rhododendri]